jgi:hypothetical protein
VARYVYCKDAADYLDQHHQQVEAIFTGLPDAQEVDINDAFQYRIWFDNYLDACLDALQPDGYAIFYQTDRRMGGGVISKAHLVMDAAKGRHLNLVWHKIVLRRRVGVVDLYRPTYSHMLCISRRTHNGQTTLPDVIDAGHMTYPNATGYGACKLACTYLANRGVQTVTDPFCGRGSALAWANYLGMVAVGVDIDEGQCEQAQRLEITSDETDA